MKIREIMSRDPACSLLSDTAQTAARILCDRNIGSMPVVADHQSRKLIGMITDRDLCCSVIADGMDPKTTQIEKFITLAPFTCRDGENVETCERLMQEHQVRRIPIVDAEDRVVGIVSQADLALKQIYRKKRIERGNLIRFQAEASEIVVLNDSRHRQAKRQQKRVVLTALGVWPDGHWEIIHWQIASGETSETWKAFFG